MTIEKTISKQMAVTRPFPTSAAARYDRALHRSQVLNPLPDGVEQPLPTSCWPQENVALLEKYREWLVAGGASDAVINQHRIPVAGHFLGLALKPAAQICLERVSARTRQYIRAKQQGEMWQRNCEHSLRWFCTFLAQELGLARWDKPKVYGDEDRYKAGLPHWLLKMLTKQLHLRQGNWRKARQAERTYQFWGKYTQLWRWLIEHEGIENAAEIRRRHVFRFIDGMLAAGYAPKTINVWLYTFQSTLRFMDERGIVINRRLLMIQGLKVDDSLPRFLSAEQVTKVRQGLEKRVDDASTAVQIRDSRLDRAVFTLLWQTGMRLSELEDLTLTDLDLSEGSITIRQSKGLKDRVVYLTDTLVKVLTAYLKVRGPALSDHVFIYRHKQVSKDLVRLRVKAAGQRVGVYVTPHMLRHTFATQLVNAGAKITTIQSLLGHQRLNTTMTYVRVHDQVVMNDYFRAMEQIEGEQASVLEPAKVSERIQELLQALQQEGLSDKQQLMVEEIRRSLQDPDQE